MLFPHTIDEACCTCIETMLLLALGILVHRNKRSALALSSAFVLLQALGAAVADSFRGLLGEASADAFNPDLLRDEPLDKVQAYAAEY